MQSKTVAWWVSNSEVLEGHLSSSHVPEQDTSCHGVDGTTLTGKDSALAIMGASETPGEFLILQEADRAA